METRASWRYRQLLTQTMLIMKMIFILLTAGMLQVHATGLSQTVTLHGENMKLEKILSSIQL